MSEIVGLRQIAKRLRRSPAKIQQWIKKKALPAFRVDGEGPYILREKDLDKWLERQKPRN